MTNFELILFFLAGIGRAALSGGISGSGFGVTLLHPSLGGFGVNSFFGALSGYVAVDPKLKMTDKLHGAFVGGILGNIPSFPSNALGSLAKFGKIFVRT